MYQPRRGRAKKVDKNSAPEILREAQRKGNKRKWEKRRDNWEKRTGKRHKSRDRDEAEGRAGAGSGSLHNVRNPLPAGRQMSIVGDRPWDQTNRYGHVMDRQLGAQPKNWGTMNPGEVAKMLNKLSEKEHGGLDLRGPSQSVDAEGVVTKGPGKGSKIN